LFAEY